MTGLIIVLHETKLSLLRSAKREFFNAAFEENKNNVGAIWKTIKTLTGTKKGTTQHVKKFLTCNQSLGNHQTMLLAHYGWCPQ